MRIKSQTFYITKVFYIAVLAIILICKSFYSSAQQNLTMYFMPEIYQAKFLNPSYQQSCRVVLGLPALSSIYFNYTNTNISYNKIFSEKSTTSNHVLDPDVFIKKLSKKNYISFDTHIQLFSLGIRVKQSVFSLDITEKIGISLGIPKKLIGFPLHGNLHEDYINTSFKGLEIDLDHYREYALGYSRQIDEDFIVGGRAKLLFGKLNFYTKKLDIGINTDPDDFAWTVYADSKINFSLPVNIQQDQTGAISGVEPQDIDPVGLLLNRKNYGAALDIGATYHYDERISLYASIIDIGMIRWRSNLNNIQQDGEFAYEGVEDLFNFRDTDYSEFLDSLYNVLLVDVSNKKYFSYLPLKMYIGATYDLNRKTEIGALNRYMIYNKKVFPSFTLSLNYQLFKSFKTSLSYSVINRSYTNIGLGFYIGRKGLQFYMVNDNINPRIQDLQNIDLRFGFNIILGCKIKEKVAKGEACPWMKRMDPDWLKNKMYYPKHIKKRGSTKYKGKK